MNRAADLLPSKTKHVLSTPDQFKFQNPWDMAMMTKSIKDADTARMEGSKFLNEITFFNICSLKHVEIEKKPTVPLQAIEIEKNINSLRLGKIFIMRNNQWIETPPAAVPGTITRHPKQKKTEGEVALLETH
ncbi:hypothetical protein scyTo_0004044 [Scyliorhinus torazame]|uniref:Uncharacterized protein n=1 Tax=Scyliorhinus torazame TaxID=75743 RepID=A0A401NJP0_SCYTO|nr:hypothetical protein [Scyliorhinus torazame]